MSGIDRRSLMIMSVLGAAIGVRSAPAQAAPTGYPENYQKIIEDAQNEGSLLIYSIMSPENWRPVIEGFNKLYPKIKVETLDLPASRESFERYLAERSTNSRTCDLIATADPGGWIDFQERGEILDYTSPEAQAWPDWSKPFPGVYTVSSDPMAMIWNNSLVPEGKRPKTLAEFVEVAVANEKAWRNRITSYGVHQTTFGYGISYAFVKKHGDKAWEWFAQLAKLAPRFERSGGPMTEKVTSGEYVEGWFVSAITFWPRLNDPARAKILGWSFIGDGQPVVLRGVAIPKGSKNVNAAKLMLDFIISEQGQRAFGRGGLTPARPGVQPGDGIRHTYSSIVQAVGEQNICYIGYDRDAVRDYDSFVARWKKTFNVA
ncbi:ABC transporter substrate-binding protein [Bradyrhizobium tropiciagri]|uniref:ABC transporter substrate-binding protein n=1 Tax=Bradyrhizobium tropiciagri TaxID=312253 RepID=UPI0020131537|nr:extracellular solute-binding protein [Bradyrhizobium tropiciagri]